MEFVVNAGGDVVCADVCAGMLRNKARLNYDEVAGWLEGPGEGPESRVICYSNYFCNTRRASASRDFA